MKNYVVRSVNSLLASVNSFLIFMGWTDCKVKSLKLQRHVYCPEEKELTADNQHVSANCFEVLFTIPFGVC